MSQVSNIEWTDATWNPVAGCSKIAPGCAKCYAIKEVHRMAGNPNPKIRAANEGLTRVLPNGQLDWTGVMRTLPDRLDQPLRKRTPTKYFVNSLSDLFHDGIPFEYIAAVFGVMAACPQHTFQILTKRPERAVEFFAWLNERGGLGRYIRSCTSQRAEDHGLYAYFAVLTRTATYRGIKHRAMGDPWMQVFNAAACTGASPLRNVWIGTSISNQNDLDANLPHLLRVPVAVRFLSAEPLLAPVEFSNVTRRSDAVSQLGKRALDGIHWVVTGGESGHGARPCNVEWIRSIKDQCVAVGVPLFVKQLGAKPIDSSRGVLYCANEPHAEKCNAVVLRDRKGGDMAEWPEDLRIRQFPEVR